MEAPTTRFHDETRNQSLPRKNLDATLHCDDSAAIEEDVRILSVNKLTVEKVVLEEDSQKVPLSSVKTRKELRTIVSPKVGVEKSWSGRIQGEITKTKLKKLDKSTVAKNISKLPTLSARNASQEKRIDSINLTKNLVASKFHRSSSLPLRICKVSPTVSPEPLEKSITRVEKSKIDVDCREEIFNNTASINENVSNDNRQVCGEFQQPELIRAKAYKLSKKSQVEIEKLPARKINSFSQKIPTLYPQIFRISASTIAEESSSDVKQILQTDFDDVSDTDKIKTEKSTKPKYSKEVSEVEKRWSGQFLEAQSERTSSGSSYVEEIGSESSHDSVVEEFRPKSYPLHCPQEQGADETLRKSDEIFEETVSTVDSTSCLEDRIKAVDDEINKCAIFPDTLDDSESKNSTLYTSSSTLTYKEAGAETSCKAERVFLNNEHDYNEVEEILSVDKPADQSESDGYAELIKKITMDSSSSKMKDEKKKRGGLRRLLPGLFSPKDSRKDYKKEQKERKRRDERHFSQHQQNGIYTRSPDTMHLNEDIKRNVNLDSSLNGTIIEERLNEIKQDLFPEQGMTTSTPDHFLQGERGHMQGRRTPRLYTANSSLSSIAVEDKWIDQNIISGSPDMRKLKQNIRNEAERKCSLERKHSLQESQPRFLRNHGPSGRISAPPSERFLIRPRAVHPVDRPLPAIPQKVEFSNYPNHRHMHEQANAAYIQGEVVNYQPERYYPGNQTYIDGSSELYENGNHPEKTEINKNHSVDSGFNLTPVSAPVKSNRQFIINQNGQKVSIGVGRSPKYSPSSSQKSGDYADSSYTPNSSQKSEFSPGSSKSGEYYLNSPRNSSRMSPESFNGRRELDHELKDSYQVPSNVRVADKEERLYDETPRSPFEADKSSSSSSPRQVVHSQEAYTQRGSPNIPLSSNLAKLRANVENSSSRAESPRNLDQQQTLQPSSSVGRVCASPIQSPIPRDDAKSPSSTRISMSNTEQRVTSPLTIVTPASPVPCVNTSSASSKNRVSTTPLSPAASPGKNLNRGWVTSPTSVRGYSSMSTFQPRKAQPTDQILIASPKRESIYDSQPRRPASRMQLDSPVLMSESPCHRGSSNLVERLERAKSPVVAGLPEHQLPPQAFRDEPPKPSASRPLSPPTSDKADKTIARPEPIYVRRQGAQRALSPLAFSSEQRRVSPVVVDARPNMLLVQTRAGSVARVSSPSPAREQSPRVAEAPLCVQEQPRRMASPCIVSPDARRQLQMSPHNRPELQLRRKDHSPSAGRPQAIYEDEKVGREMRSASSDQIYVRKTQQSPVPTAIRSPGNQCQLKVELSQSPRADQRQIYPSTQEVVVSNQEAIYGKSVISREPIYVKRSGKQEAIYAQRVSEPIYGQTANKQLSPSKRQTMQHLEAFYWQQKALESQNTSINSSSGSRNQEAISPQVREAIYWQQLKKLDEEQQRKIFERNQFDERTEPDYWKRKIHSSTPSPTILQGSTSSPKLSQVQIHVEHQSEPIYWRKASVGPAAKPPLSGQKGLNQPVLIVRPQQAVRDCDQSQLSLDSHSELKDFRSKINSPHFVRNDERRSLQLPRKPRVLLEDTYTPEKSNTIVRKSTSPQIYDDTDTDRKQPPPIFKRGSLISNSSNSVDYGTVGPKRVSFSNQSNSPEIGSGNWPTKHGMAPEPPTRKHRSEERISSDVIDPNSSQLHEEDQNNVNIIYGNTTCVHTSPSVIYETEYDAKPLPLPPPPSQSDPWLVKRSNSMRDIKRLDIQRANVQASPRKVPVSESESGSEAGEVQKILQRQYEEEWNPGGKGRQSNDTGGSGRAEGEGGSNDLPGGRRGGGGGVLGSVVGGRATGAGRSRDEPRRHTLSGDHAPSLHHQQFNAQQLHPLHPHHLPPPHGQYGTPTGRHTTMDLEMGTKSRQRKAPLPRGYPPPSTAMLFDDDPGIMSEVETSSTGFRRGGKQRSSLPVVRTPSKTLERPLGLVFLQYRKETKRALLPNEITSIDTVKALFVRSFSKQLTMEYLDSPDVKVYIHDSNKDMFYELEDHRSHLRDIRDRSVLRLIEKTDGPGGMTGPLGAPVGGPPGLPPHWEDQSYFSEPEFDSEFQHQHIHKSKTAKNSSSGSYYMGGSSTLPRGGPIMRAYSPAASAVLAGPNSTPTQPKSLGPPGGGGVAPAKPLRGLCGKTPLGSLGGSARFSRDSSVSLYSIPDRLHGESGYMSSPERGGSVGAGSGRYPGGPYSTGSSYEEPYYSQYSGTVTPVIDEEASDTELLEESYSMYGVKPPGRPPSGPPRSPFPPGAPALPPGQPYDVTRIRVEHMERQLANLTGLVQKALTHAPHTSPSPRDYLQIPGGRDPYARSTGAGDEFDKHSSSSSASLPDESYLRTDVKPPKLGKDKSVSFEKSVSFSDEPPDMNSPKQHSPQHAADTKPTKPAIKSSTLPRMSSQERDRHKPAPPPKPVALAPGQYVYRDLALTPEMYNQLRGLQKKAKDLRQEVRNLRRMSQAQAHSVRETIRDTFITIRAMLLAGGDAAWAAGDAEKIRLSREEDLYKQEMIRLEKDLTELESTVEELRGNVINRKTRVNMSDVENMALILSKSSKTVADLKVRFPNLQESMKGLLSSEMEKVVREEKFLKEEPDRLESALRRCKKLTGTLVTLKRLASVQEQRLPNAPSLDSEETPPVTPTSAQQSKTTASMSAERTVMGSASIIGGGSHVDSSAAYQQRPENALDALLDELQTFSRPSSQLSQVSGMSQPNHMPTMLEIGRSASQIMPSGRAPNMSDIGRKGSIDSSSSLAIVPPGTNTLRRLHSYPSSSDTDTSPPIARIQVSDGTTPPQKPPVPERNAELLQLATARRVPPPPPPRTSSRSPLASPTSPQLPPRNPTGTLRRGRANAKDSGKPPMALPPNAALEDAVGKLATNNILSASNSSSCESINSQEGQQNKKERQDPLEVRHQELLRKQKALQEQYARLQRLTTAPPAPPDLLKKTGSESNLLAKMGLGMSAASSGSLTSLSVAKNGEQAPMVTANDAGAIQNFNATPVAGSQTTTNKIYETDIL